MSSVSLPELRAEVRAFLREELIASRFVPCSNAWMDGHDPSFSARIGAQGWIGMTWPTRYGGSERTAFERYAVIEELLAAGAPVAAHWFADRQVGPLLLRFGTEEQRHRYLPEIAAGRLFFAIGMSEPGAGSDLAAVRTRAERVDGGWLVRGAKVWTSHGAVAHRMVALCRTSPANNDRHAGLSQLIIDLHDERVDARPITSLDGAAHFSEVLIDGAFVPDTNVVGAIGAGWSQVMAELAYERSGPERFLSTLPLLREAIVAIGRAPTAADGERLGRSFASLVALRQLSVEVVEALDRGEQPGVMAALVKDLGTRFEQDQVEDLRLGLQPGAGTQAYASLHSEVQLAAPGFTLRGGTTEVLRSIIGRDLVRT
jgi:alkylation response protein AidB-like acyl-CoA dehydrogenase